MFEPNTDRLTVRCETCDSWSDFVIKLLNKQIPFQLSNWFNSIVKWLLNSFWCWRGFFAVFTETFQTEISVVKILLFAYFLDSIVWFWSPEFLGVCWPQIVVAYCTSWTLRVRTPRFQINFWLRTDYQLSPEHSSIGYDVSMMYQWCINDVSMIQYHYNQLQSYTV